MTTTTRMAAQPFRVGITVQQHEAGQYVGDRIACRSLTQLVALKKDMSLEQRQHQYRMDIVRMLRNNCEKHKDGIQLVKRFLVLAHTLEHTKAVALPIGHHTNSIEKSDTLQQAWNKTLGSELVSCGKLLANQSHILQHPIARVGLIHPLIIAVLAFRLGGPVNAAGSTHVRQWRLPDQMVSAFEVQNFHMEGDSGNIFDDHRVTLVWEEGKVHVDAMSGSHHLFLSGDVTPQPLNTASSDSGNCANAPLTIMFDSRNASLFYQCQSSEVTRHSISLDFHLHTTCDEMLELLQVFKKDKSHLEGDDLMKLLTTFPSPQYGDHFQRLLFSPESLEKIFDKLGKIQVPEAHPSSTLQNNFMKQIEDYKHENQRQIPRDILCMQQDVLISGTYSSMAIYLQHVICKARRDVHLPLGGDLFPYNAIDKEREYARKYIRDVSAEVVARRLTEYESVLTKFPYTTRDLLSTAQLQGFAVTVENWCQQLCGTGFISPSGILAHLPLLIRALGLALNGKKEVHVNPQPCINEKDLQIYRTRCLYLFWCADWLVDYLGKPIEGPHMLWQDSKEKLVVWRANVEMVASMLLRNWVAWGLFVEGLPKGEMRIRMPERH